MAKPRCRGRITRMGSYCRRASYRSFMPAPAFGRQVGRLLWLACLAWVMAVGVASAQMDEPIGRFAADVRVSLPRFKQLPDVAVWYGVADTDLPTWGKGLEAGAHVYPLTWRFITFGVGGAVLIARAHSGLTELDGYVTGHVVDVQFTSVSSHVSLNFGKNSGWSYLSGGLGWSWMAITTRAEPIDATARRQTIHYGGGARWFSGDHIGFTLDLRVHRIGPQPQTEIVKPVPGMNVFVASLGVTFK
jgi:hypothetical protein